MFYLGAYTSARGLILNKTNRAIKYSFGKGPWQVPKANPSPEAGPVPFLVMWSELPIQISNFGGSKTPIPSKSPVLQHPWHGLPSAPSHIISCPSQPPKGRDGSKLFPDQHCRATPAAEHPTPSQSHFVLPLSQPRSHPCSHITMWLWQLWLPFPAPPGAFPSPEQSKSSTFPSEPGCHCSEELSPQS